MNMNRFLCLITAVCFTWFAGATHAQFNNITASPNTLFVSTATNVKFVADVKPDPKLINTSIRLLRENNGVWSVIGTMRDDGLSGDDLAGDSRFTLISSAQSSSLTTLNFRASAAYSGLMKRIQSSILPLDVVAALDLNIETGQQEITLAEGESVSTAFTLQLSNQAGGQSKITASQTVTPNVGGITIVTDLPAAGFTTSQTSQTFLVQNKFTGNIAGEYLVKLDGALTVGAKTDQASATINIHVLPANGIGKLGLSVYPGGLKVGTSGKVTFGARYSVGTALPAAVHLVEVTAQGATIQTLAPMKDDGVVPDIGASDLLFTVEPTLSAGVAGTTRYFRAVASFVSGATTQSSILTLPSLPFDIGFAPIDPSLIVQDPATGVQFPCNQALVVFQPGTLLTTIMAAVTAVGGSVIGAELSINTYQISIPCSGVAGVQAVVNTLKANPAVVDAGPNSLAQVTEFKPNDPKFSTQTAPQQVRADEAWLIARGKGVVVAVLDTGVDYNHEDLSGRVTKGKDYVNNDNDPIDDHFHGTHVAGIAAAKGNNSKGVAGIAWDTQILAIKICGGLAGVPGVGLVTGCPDSAITSGIVEATTKAKIINMSIGDNPSKQVGAEAAITAATTAGVLVIAAAGNKNTAVIQYPCAFAGVLCVGNATSSDTRYATSNFGPHVHIAAPGDNILSTVPSFNDPSGYRSYTGTSQSAPLVSGVAALVWANNPAWTRAQVQERLLKTAVPLPGQKIGPRVDAFDAVFNGSFEHDLSGWKVVGTGSAVDKLGPINPTKDKRMGMASTGPNAAVSSSDLFQTFTVQPDVTELVLSFSYAMITEEYPEWINRGFNDDLRVTLEAPGGGTTEVALETVDGSAFVPIGGIDFPGGDSTVGWTGWKNIASKKIPITPGGGAYRLRVRDRGDGIYDTNGVLDNIRFK